uniref:UDP-2,3-diacylglucosamine diphosphatase n=1 Tax=Thaumasiovibrio occultus TaxID=1891184 RepID=UPI000B359699|nr:UDP-2,3-diacylglucosamine diphosphatase [Thaumasiovibrio occultus]
MNDVRTIWLSDLHLGHRDSKTDFLIDFLDHYHADTIVLVGDIVDLWALNNRHHWPESHNTVLSMLLDRAHQGCKLVYIPGNHDTALRQFIKFDFGKVEVKQRYIHTSATGKRILALHGDEFDSLVCHSKLHAFIGDVGYDFLLWLNRWWSKSRRLTGLPYWSLAGYLKARVDKANAAITRFRDAAMSFAKRQQCDAIVCGHIHHPEIVESDTVTYLNDGDWIENCTALIEQHDGTLDLIQWTENANVISSSQALGVVSDRRFSYKDKVA